MASAYKRKGSPFWWVQSRENGRQVRESTGVRHNGLKTIPPIVKQILAKLEADEASLKFGVPRRWEPVTVRQAIRAEVQIIADKAAAEAISDNHAENLSNSFFRYENYLKQAGIIQLSDLTPATAQQLRLNSIKPTSFSVERGHLAALWDRYISEEKAPLENHWNVLRLGGECEKKRCLSNEEIELLSALLPDAPLEMQYLTRMGFYMGCRISMAARLNIDQIDFDQRLIRFGKIKRKEHSQALHDALYSFLLDYPLLPSGWFVDQSVGNWSARYNHWLDSVRKQTGYFDGISHHCLRVTFNTKMAESGLPEQVTMDIIGHSTRAAHDRYKDIKAAKFQSTIDETIRGL